MILRPFRLLPPKRTTIFLMMVIMLQNVDSEPQDGGSIFENVASQAIAVGGNMAEMVGNAGMMSKNTDFEMPFVKAKSESKAGTGAALRNDDDDDSSEEDRRKRSTDFKTKEDTLVGEEFLLPLPLKHQHHFHRDKRSPCHTYGGGTPSGTGGGTPTDDGDTAIEQRRRRAYARKRKAAAKRAKSKKTSTSSRKKTLISDADEDNNHALARRKRQSEVNDLNQDMQSMGNNFAQHAQQIGEKIRNFFDNFAASMSDMAQKLKQKFSNQNATNIQEI